MTKPVLTPKSFFTTLTIMHLSFFVAMLFLAGIAYYLNQNHNLDFENIDIILFVVLVSVSLFGVIGGQSIKNKTIEKAESKILLREKLGAYQTASLIQYAFVEGPAFFGIVLYIQTAEFVYLLIAFVMMIYFLTLKPKKERITKALRLGRDHQIEFNRENQELN
jgi:tellurite resistance protein TehA-like permease